MGDAKPGPRLVLLVFIHGQVSPSASSGTSASPAHALPGATPFSFKGSDQTFEEFPERLIHILSAQYLPDDDDPSATRTGIQFEAAVFPAYDTRGELVKAVDRFIEWLSLEVAQRENKLREGGTGAPRVGVVLCGHSMGGLVAAEAALLVHRGLSDPAKQVWPEIVGVIAYDTPYLGLHPHMIKNSADEYIGYAKQGHAVLTALGTGWAAWGASSSKPNAPSGSRRPTPGRASPSGEPSESNTTMQTQQTAANGWSRWTTIAGATAGLTAIAGAGAAAYMNREQLDSSFKWATSHLEFVGVLWDGAALKARLDNLVKLQVGFHCFYTFLPPKQPAPSRTFIILPHRTDTFAPHFTPNSNSKALNEVDAHVSMFNPTKNDGFYKLGQETAALVHDWLHDRTFPPSS